MLPWTEILLRLFVAALLTSMIGLEREFKHKPVGFRTNMLVGMGSALFMIISLSFVDSPERIATGVVSGIGFLGAGLIIQSQGELHGITTAASIWMVAAIGLATGMGYYSAAVIATILALVVLLIFGKQTLREKFKLDN
ncbi:MAG: MgtC/SapB family protein [Candidatus Buchananbacteria bacterium]|nr:MgtC/SapB family protein [Candidatus Buchananbacteria bacterium]